MRHTAHVSYAAQKMHPLCASAKKILGGKYSDKETRKVSIIWDQRPRETMPEEKSRRRARNKHQAGQEQRRNSGGDMTLKGLWLMEETMLQ